ncbi:MAG: hypothetical protein GY942_19440 [Aestuariibacter sp.]|nr:hypothetical protein [Halieaceae bacterium]MCP5012157.1 hypothetical protein [Aestuariibacter sp.]
MVALTKDRNTLRKDNLQHEDGVAAATEIFAGSLACLNAAGFAVPGSTSTTLTARGVAQSHVDNSDGANGDLTVPTRRGTFKFANSAATDEITIADIDNDCYIVDDQTVARTDGTGTRSVAGKVDSVDSDGVWVTI